MESQFGGMDVELIGLRKAYRSGSTQISAVREVSVKIEGGSFVAITGQSGSGKSTLLRLIGALETPDAGDLIVGGRNITKLRSGQLAGYRRSVGFVFQGFHLLPALTALDNVALPLMVGTKRKERRPRAIHALTEVGLGNRGSSQPARLSGGQQQRVAIARALVVRPQLLLADEPTGSLDSTTTHEILNLLTGLRESRGMTLVIATHDPQVAATADRVIEISDGSIEDDRYRVSLDHPQPTKAHEPGLVR